VADFVMQMERQISPVHSL